MTKLYKTIENTLHYHEAWVEHGKLIEHWGIVGKVGAKRESKVPFFSLSRNQIKKALSVASDEGYKTISIDDHAILIIEYSLYRLVVVEQLKKRHLLQDYMDDLLGRTGLGHCDGGSIGSGTMEVCCYVVDYKEAKKLIKADLMGTHFGNYSKIYREST